MIVRPHCWRSDSPPPPSRSQSQRGGPCNPLGAIFCLVPLEGGLKLVPDPIWHLGSAPTIVIAAAIVIIVVVDVTPTLTLSLRVGQPITCYPVNVDIAVRAAAVELFHFRSVPSLCGWRWGHWREWSLLLTPVLAARADNGNDKDSCIIVEETREKTRRGQQQGNHPIHHGHVRQYVHRCGLSTAMTVSAPAATTRE
jgi:hypothetical protein